MGNFITGNPALPPLKTDAFPPQGLSTELDAADINNIWSALGDVREQVRGWVSVTSSAYGADPTGVADSTAAFNGALSSGAKKVYAPQGAYKITGTLNIPADVHLYGANKRTTQLLHAFNGDMITMADGATISDLYIEGQGATYTGRGLVLSGTDGHQRAISCKIVNFDSACIDFAVGAGSQSMWRDLEIYRTAAGTGTGRYAITIADASQLTAVPRTFAEIQTGGNCAFSFGGANDLFIDHSFLADLAYTANTRGVQITTTRIANQTALTVNGHNNSIVACDVLPQITIAAGTDHIVIGPNSLNNNAVIDLSAGVNGNLVFQAPITYTPTLTAATTNPVIGNGTLRGEWSRNGSKIHLVIEYTVGSTDTFGSGTWQFSLPITPPGQSGSPALQSGTGYCRQNSTAAFEFILPLVVNGTSYVVLQRAGSGGPQVNQAAPYAWAAGDIIRFTVDYHL